MRIFQPTYTKPGRGTLGGPSPLAETRRSSVWWCEFTVNGKAFRLSTGLRDKNAAQARAAQLLRDEELRAAGIETHGDTTRATLACLFDEYRAELTRRRCVKKHVETTLARCLALTAGCATVADLTPVRIRLGLERLRGASAKTVNAYRTALSGFCAWLVREGRWASNPVEAVERARETVDGPARRALTPEEQQRLLAVPSPYNEAYRVALNTGLRRSELLSLRCSDYRVHSDGSRTIRIRGASAKNKREAYLPLPTSFGPLMGPGTRVDDPDPPLLCVPSMARFRRDLNAAYIDSTDVDFHSLRVTFATNLARAGVPLTLAQRLMRHSDPALTSNIYTHLAFTDEQSAVDRAVPDQVKEGNAIREDAARVAAGGLPRPHLFVSPTMKAAMRACGESE